MEELKVIQTEYENYLLDNKATSVTIWDKKLKKPVMAGFLDYGKPDKFTFIFISQYPFPENLIILDNHKYQKPVELLKYIKEHNMSLSLEEHQKHLASLLKLADEIAPKEEN